MSIESIDLLIRFIDWIYEGTEGLSEQQVADIINEFLDHEEK